MKSFMKNMKLSKNTNEQAQTIAVIIVIYIVLLHVYYQFTKFTKTIQIKSHIDSISGMGRFIQGSNMISDIDNNIYIVSNNIFLWHFHANEILSKLEPGRTYIIDGYGVRVPVIGLYPHILNVKTN